MWHIKLFSTILAFSLFTSCCSSRHFVIDNNNLQHIQSETEKNVVHLSVEQTLKVFSKETKKLVSNTKTFSGGSGVVIQTENNVSLLLTASHVCVPVSLSQIKKLYNEYDETKHFLEKDGKAVIQVNTGEMFPGYVLTYHEEKDICVILTTFTTNEISIANSLEKYEEVYYQGFPLSFFSGVLTPTFNGAYLGNSTTTSNEMAEVFSFPTTYGGSGSPVFNSKGELVGIIHSFVKDFHHFSLSSTIEDIKLTLKVAKKLIQDNEISFRTLQGVQ